jgi:hypothetical protein
MFIGLLTICQRIDTSSAIQMATPPPAHKLSLQMGSVISKYGVDHQYYRTNKISIQY